MPRVTLSPREGPDVHLLGSPMAMALCAWWTFFALAAAPMSGTIVRVDVSSSDISPMLNGFVIVDPAEFLLANGFNFTSCDDVSGSWYSLMYGSSAVVFSQGCWENQLGGGSYMSRSRRLAPEAGRGW